MERIDGRIIHDVYLDRVVFRETFTGDGSATTFTLDGTVGNATFKYGAWSIANVKTTLPAHITKTNKKPAYDSLVPLTRNRISVSSINATTGVVTLDYAPRNTVDFYVWYWYDLPNHHLLEDYYREDFVASIEDEATAYGTDIAVDTTNFGGIFTAADNTAQKAFDTADDHTHALLHAQVHAIDGADHTAAGLTAGHFLKATGATTFGFSAHGLSYGDVGAEASGTMTTHESTYDHANYDTAYGWGDHAGLYGLIGDVAANTAKVTESTTVTSPLVLTTYDISIPAATNAAAGHATAAHITAIEANTAKVTCNFTNVQTALAAATGAVAFNSQNLTGVGTIGCGTITTTGNLVLPANGVVGVTDGNPQIVFDNANNWLEITGRVGVGLTGPETLVHFKEDASGINTILTLLNQNHEDVSGVRISARGGTSSSASQYLGHLDFGKEEVWTTTASTQNSYFAIHLRNAGGSAVNVIHINSSGNVGIGLSSPTAKLHIDQSSTTAAIPVLKLYQADVSEEFVKLVGTAAAGSITHSLVDSAEVGGYILDGFVKIYIQDDGDQITDQAYYVPFYHLSA